MRDKVTFATLPEIASEFRTASEDDLEFLDDDLYSSSTSERKVSSGGTESKFFPSKAKKHRVPKTSMKQKSRSSIFRFSTVEDLTIQFDMVKDLYKLSDYSKVRPEGNYAKSFFSKKETIDTMFVHQKEPIPRSLMKLSTAYCGGKNESIKVKTEAKELFKNILGFMKDRFHTYPAVLGHEILDQCLKTPLLRDEIFCQLIKQTTENRSTESLLLGWKLIYLCLSCFGPTDSELVSVLNSHIAQVATRKLQKHIPFDTIENVAANCYLMLLKAKDLSFCNPPPSIEEIHKFMVNHLLLLTC